MKNKKMSLNPKKKCIYIKSIYISKNTKLNNSINTNFESKKIISDYNVNKKDTMTTSKQFSKKSVKPVGQSIYSQKSKCLIKGNQNFLSTLNIHIKSPKKETLDPQNLYGTNIEFNSGRKSGQKKYDITNPFKERSNSESSFNCFNRTYTSFNNNNTNKENPNGKNNNVKGNNNINNKDNIKKNNNIDNKITSSYVTINSKSNNELKINLSNINFNKNIYNIKNTIKTNKKSYNSNNNISENSGMKKSATNTSITRKGSKKFIYKEQALKKNANPNLYYTPHQNIDLNIDREKEKEKDNINITETISTQINLLSPNPSSNSKYNMHDFNSIKNPKRIQKYILSDKKRKTNSRQNFREYKNKEPKEVKERKSSSICPEPKKHLNSPKKNNNNVSSIIDNKLVKKKSNVSIYSQNGRLLHKSKNKINNKDIEDNQYRNNTNLDIIQKYYYEKDSSLDGINDCNKSVLFEQSAIMIQSVFRGYLVKNKFETNLCNYNNYNKAVEILENIILENAKIIFFQNLTKIPKKKNIHSYESCKNFKLKNIPTSPLTESDGYSFPNKFIDLYLHQEIGERFNIIKQNSDREKELEKKHKEELEIIINKNKELSNDNKKKETIINIITEDNQKIAKKLKVLKEIKNNITNLKIDNPTELYIYPDTIHPKYFNKYASVQEVLNAYRNLFLFFLIKKREALNKEQIKKYFYKYKNIVTTVKYENTINSINSNIKAKKLHDIILKNENKKILQKRNYFDKLYYITLLNKKVFESRNEIIRTKLRNLIIKKEKIIKMVLKYYFNEFHTKIIFSKLIEEKAKSLENKKNQKLINLKKTIIALDKKNKKFKLIQYKNIFTKWYLISKILSMKAVTDEKKRKKRQKQRTKRKIEKNKSMNKLFISTSLSQSQAANLDKNSISTSYKEKTCAKKKDNKDIFNYLEHTVTTDLSMAETNPENKTDKVIKGTEKLNELFIKATIFYKLLGNKNNEVNLGINKENTNIKNNDKDKKEIKAENESDNEEDSGESSFGL